MFPLIHRTAGMVATVLIAAFWSSSLVSELFLGQAEVVAVKTLVAYGLVALIPAIALAGGTGFALAGGRKGGVLGAKRARMPIIALNGLVVLVPAALFLAARARAGEFDTLFYAVQAVELVAGAVNLALLGLNIRDGRRMTAGRRRRLAA